MIRRVLVSVWFLVLAVALATAPAAAQVATAAVTISVPVVQVLEGPSSVSMLPGMAQRETLIVKSNVAWLLVARASASAATISWGRTGLSRWQLLSPTAILARGEKGVHTVDVELRRTDSAAGQAATVLLAVEIAR